MQRIQVGDLDLCVLAGVLREVTCVERHVIQEVGITDQCLPINLPSHTNVIARGRQHIRTMRFNSRRVINVIHPHSQFDIAAVISIRNTDDATKRLMTLNIELALPMTPSLLPYSLINMLDTNLPQSLLSFRGICRNGFWSQLIIKGSFMDYERRHAKPLPVIHLLLGYHGPLGTRIPRHGIYSEQ